MLQYKVAWEWYCRKDGKLNKKSIAIYFQRQYNFFISIKHKKIKENNIKAIFHLGSFVWQPKQSIVFNFALRCAL